MGDEVKHVIEGRYCPTCSHDHGTVQKFEVPVVPVMAGSVGDIQGKIDDLLGRVSGGDKTDLKPVESLLGSLSAQVKQLSGEMGTHPKPTRDFIQQVWEDCPECQAQWNQIKGEIGEEATRGLHIFTPEHIDSCPECKQQLEAMLTKQSTPGGTNEDSEGPDSEGMFFEREW